MATALKGRRFETIQEQNDFLEHWEVTWAATRIHGSERRQVQAMFEEEKPHPRAQRPGSVILPNEERVFNPSRETLYILNQAKDIGPQTHRLCEMLFGIEGRVGQRKLWGIVGLGRTYPHRLVNSTCERALLDGVYGYKHVKALTERLVADALAAIDSASDVSAQAELSLTQEHDLIRSPDEYADLFARCSAQP